MNNSGSKTNRVMPVTKKLLQENQNYPTRGCYLLYQNKKST